MMTGRLHLCVALWILTTILVAATEGPASGESCGGGSSASANGETGGFGTTVIEIVNECGGSGADPTGTAQLPPGHWVHDQHTCTLGGGGTCVDDGVRCENGDLMLLSYYQTDDGRQLFTSDSCPSDAEEAAPGPTLADIITAFKQIPLPPSKIHIQPPGGETLVNFETNFVTTAEPFNRTVTLIGHQVDFRISSTSFAWTFGDGHQRTTSTPGGTYPDMTVTHRYRTRATVKASVNTTWRADYRVDGGAWAPVPDTVTINGNTQNLVIRSATPLVADGR